MRQRKRGVLASPQGLELMEEAKAKWPEISSEKIAVLRGQRGLELMEEAKANCQNLSNEKIAEIADTTTKTVTKFLNGTVAGEREAARIDDKYARKIVAVLGLVYRDIVPSTVENLANQTIQQVKESSDGEQAKNLIQELESGLSRHQESEGIESVAAQWLELNVSKILNQNDIEHEIKKINVQEQIDADRFTSDLQVYMEVVQYCLEIGSFKLVDNAIEESLLPDIYEVDLYVHFLEFIRDYKVTDSAPSGISNKIIMVLNYMIKILPIKL